MSNGWSWWVIVLVTVNIAGCVWLLVANRTAKVNEDEKGNSTGHSFDGIEELNNPLPAWWTWLFVGTIAFAIGYLILYPGMGNYAGTLGWTSTGQYQEEIDAAQAEYGPIFAAYMQQPIPELIGDKRAIEIGSRLFANNCAQCHGSDARGGPGYPNLADDDWLYGNAPETVVATITGGRNGTMPPFGAAIGGEAGAANAAQYVISLSGREHDAEMATAGAETFKTICSACHGQDGKGNQALGSPNLTDDIWLHGGRVSDIENRAMNGITSQMPAHRDILGEEKIHLVAAYVLSLSADSNDEPIAPDTKVAPKE
jgi:cytochrome c oxidase cbb3-type subunit 3